MARLAAGARSRQPTKVVHKQDIQLTGQSTKYRYYLVWITDLGGHTQLAIDEVALYR